MPLNIEVEKYRIGETMTRDKMISANEIKETLSTVYDCLDAISYIHDAHTDHYNGTIATLIDYARDQIESLQRDIGTKK